MDIEKLLFENDNPKMITDPIWLYLRALFENRKITVYPEGDA